MGAQDFSDRAQGKTAQEAFTNARDDAAWEHGHGGYTGTIAEKQEFTMIELPKGLDPETYVRQLMEADDRRVTDKWGPAGCFDLGNGHFFFFGRASS